MIKVNALAKSLGADRVPVLKNISFEVHHGEMIAVVGPSGSGKSMLLRCLALRESWDQGTFIIDGTDILKGGMAGRSKLKREWAFLEQNPTLYLNKTAHKNVIIGMAGQTPLFRRVTGMVRSDDYMGAMDVLEELGLLDKAKEKAQNLSGGERQRVAIARALVHGASVILADEPVIGLDPHSADAVLGTLKSLCEKEKMTVITVLPIELAEKHASRIWGISDGEIIFDIRGRRLTMAEKNKL
ncbi:ATP-binding cassette domain-containing protein [Paenibacillus sp. JX-17]|uniref:ATP-binding cassette domain-containing protein n=1 Tax=Paenibacillus lacisoli TaxID=3064525 RepID=A0ABT9C6K8_9BACL|nr:ATP-binding cassette domain-containing protein [Paenibacillus sp. JX-17]MDO7904893.1 ATP-binding cassette domain-containing protein [Paenibacillus sp. JX-17]